MTSRFPERLMAGRFLWCLPVFSQIPVFGEFLLAVLLAHTLSIHSAFPLLLFQAKASGKKLQKVTLTVSPRGIILYDSASNQLIENISIYRSVLRFPPSSSLTIKQTLLYPSCCHRRRKAAGVGRLYRVCDRQRERERVFSLSASCLINLISPESSKTAACLSFLFRCD